MTDLAVRCRQSFKRYSELLSVVAFILADCFASGWVLIAGTVAAILYVIVPADRSLRGLSSVEQVTFLKAYAKTQRVQQVGLLLFWMYSIRFLVYAASKAVMLWEEPDKLPTLSTALLMGAQHFAPLASLGTPILFYAGACLVAILLRRRLTSTKKDPDLIQQRQRWSGAAQFLFLCAFVAGILAVSLHANGPAYMISNWLLASARDANVFFTSQDELMSPACTGFVRPSGLDIPVVGALEVPQHMLVGVGPGTVVSSFIGHFDAFIISSFSLVLFTIFLKPAMRMNAFLTSFCWRVVSPGSLQNLIEAFLEALRLPARTLDFREAHPLVNNAWRTLAWIICCYVSLFWLFGFCGGPLGDAINNWMMASAVDAGFQDEYGAAPAWLFSSSFRIFLGSIVALYGTGPIAITAAVFLPFATDRKITVNCDGLLFSQGPYLALLGRQFRLWSDLRSFSVKTEKNRNGIKAKFKIVFRSGGALSFTSAQISAGDLKVLLEGIDEHASDCVVDPLVYEVCATLAELQGDVAFSDGSTESGITALSADDFKSTVFVPLSSGEFIPATQIRVIKQLASKPLCAVYLARDDAGRLLTVKQFYLATDDEETRALSKIFQREFELLSTLDHPGIAKVVNSFSHGKSTFLLIEHRLGSDMREIVKEHGPRSEATTIDWAKQLCKIMQYLHARQPAITHRDLTPDNVIVGEDGQLRLIDFGAAREFLEGITGTMLGKHCYVAPEQLRGEASPRSDIYSFGATLYHLLTGRDPVALSQSSPAKIIHCSDELDLLIKQCTEFDEDKRPQSFEEIQTRLNDMDRGIFVKLSSKNQKVSV